MVKKMSRKAHLVVLVEVLMFCGSHAIKTKTISRVESGRAHQAASSIAHETASPFAEQACLVAEELDAAVQR